MNFLGLFNKVLLELNYRPLSRDMVTSAPESNDFERIFKAEHLRVLENLKRVNAEVTSSANWDFLPAREDSGENPEEPQTAPKIYSAQDVHGEPKINLEGPDDVSVIPRAFLDVLIYGATLKTKANPAHPKFAFWSSSYTRALARMRAECKANAQDVPHITIEQPRAAHFKLQKAKRPPV